jgi:uncharacterized iron-regulated membrane protein
MSSARRTLIKIHLWLGLTLGLLWAVQGLTGALLVFHREEDRFIGLPASGGPPAPIDSIVASAEAVTNGAPIVRFAIADGRRDRINVFYAHGESSDHLRAVVIDASTAQVLAMRDMHPTTPFAGAPNEWIDMLHMALLGGHRGEIFIAFSGLFLLSATLIGLYIAWPSWRSWKFVLAYKRWRTADQRLYGWHRAAGLCAALFFAVLACTGACMNLDDPVQTMAMHLGDYRMPYRAIPVQELPSKMISPGEALSSAQRSFSGAPWVRLFMPTPAEPVYFIRFLQKGENREWLGKSAVVIDPVTGRVLDRYDAITVPWTNRWIDAAFPLHNGELLGLPGRIAVLLAGLALPALYVTGVWRWWRRRSRIAA